LLPTVGVVLLLIVVSWLPNWLVLANALVMIDNFVWIVVFLVLLLVIAAAFAIRYAGGAKRASACPARSVTK
jgi:hypothetical protein